MGYYTEFRFRVKLKENTPKDIIEVLDQVINNNSEYYEKLWGGEVPIMHSVFDTPNLPIEHPFGKCPRWRMLFHSNNFDPENIEGSSFNKEDLELSIHTEFKDYDDEIRLFIKWMAPHIDKSHLTEIWSRGETWEEKDTYTHML